MMLAARLVIVMLPCLALLTGCAVSALRPHEATALPSVVVTDRAQVSGPWRLTVKDGRRVGNGAYVLNFAWPNGDTFIAQRGCSVAMGQLVPADGAGAWLVDRYDGFGMDGCDRIVADKLVAPFDGDEVAMDVAGNRLLVRAEGGQYVFERIPVDRRTASTDFLHGDWLLTDSRGAVFRGAAATRLTLGPGLFRLHGPCRHFETNGYVLDEGMGLRPGGSRHVTGMNACSDHAIGDRLASDPTAASWRAVPVEGRIEVRLGGARYSFVPAARHPELAEGAAAYPAHPWAERLAAHFGTPAHEPQRTSRLARVIGLQAPGTAAARAMELERQGPGGIDMVDWAHLRAGLDGERVQALAGAGFDASTALRAAGAATLDQAVLIWPRILLADVEATVAVDRGDGLAHDVQYRIVEPWRGGGDVGDLVIVRLPTVTSPAQQAAFMPRPGSRVLLFASRHAYLAERLVQGAAPSTDTRILAGLPPIRIVDGRAQMGQVAGFPGMPAVDGLATAALRDRIAPLGRRIDAALAGSERPARETLLVEAIDGEPVTKPGSLWIHYDWNAPQAGRVVGGTDGCNAFSRGKTWTTATDVGCDSDWERAQRLPQYRATLFGAEALEVPEQVSIGDPIDPYAPLDATANGHRLTFRRPLR